MKRKLGRSEIEVSALGLGCWAIGGPFGEGEDALGWGVIDIKEAVKALNTGIELGINFIDTADVYGAGQSERIIAQAVQGKREQVVIATKFGIVFNEETKQVMGTNATPEYIFDACNASLKRLETDYIDLYQFHLNDYSLEGANTVRDTLEELVSLGKIRTYGWSTDFVDRAKVFEKGENFSSVQHQMNVLDDANEMIRYCEDKDLASINRGPLAMGLLTGKYNVSSKFTDDDVRGDNSPSWMQYFQDGKANPIWLDRFESIKEILSSDGRTVGQGALAWLLGRSESTLPIPGFKNAEQVKQNCSVLDYGPLTKSQIEEIDKLLDR